MQFSNLFYTADNGLVILAENFHHYFYTTTSFSSGTGSMPGQSRTTTYSVGECGDMLMSKIDAGGNIGWMQVLPKLQREISVVGYSRSFGISYFQLFQ